MIRRQVLVLLLVTLCNGVHANVAKDTGRIVAGAAVGAAGFAALNTAFNAAKAFVAWDAQDASTLNTHAIRLFALAGGTVGLWTTTYSRTLRAQWDVWFWRSSKELIAITMTEYENDAQLVDAVQHYCLAHAYPLVAAKRELAYRLNDLNSAAGLIEAALEDIAQDSSRAQELNDWLDEIYTIRGYVAHAAKAVEKDPRLHLMMEAQNSKDRADALTSHANVQWADLAARIAFTALESSMSSSSKK